MRRSQTADLVVTVTGARDVVTAADAPLLKPDAVLRRDAPGHCPVGDREPTALGARGPVHRARRRPHGHLAGPRPLGNSIESMDLGFALQARCLEAVATGAFGPESCVVPVPRSIDERVAAEFVATV